ncbi:MAG: hypothetical protein WCK34_04590 [Bacteroidota bacterium]
MKPIPFLLRAAVLAMFCFMLAGCKTFVRLNYGMLPPGDETPDGLVAFLEKHRFPANDLYLFKDSASYFAAMRNPVFVTNFLSNMNFDRNGSLIRRDTTLCQWSGAGLIRELNPDSAYRVWPGLRLDQILPHIEPFGKNKSGQQGAEKPDFTIVVTWAKFIGKYNYRLFNLADAVKANKKARIRVIWLNVDMQQSWHVAKEQRINFR